MLKLIFPRVRTIYDIIIIVAIIIIIIVAIYCFKNLGSQVSAGGGCERDVIHNMNEGSRAWRSAEKCAEQ